jgi:hypothetical protein
MRGRTFVLMIVLSLAGLRCTRPLDLVSLSTDAGTDGAALDAGPTAVDSGPTPTITCPRDPSITLLTDKNELYYFDPKADVAKSYGVISCPEAGGNAVSLAVDDNGLTYVAFDSGLILQMKEGAVTTCAQWGKVPALPTSPNGIGFAIDDSKDPSFHIGVDQGVYQTGAAAFGVWSQIGKLDPADHVSALMGTGDGRLFAVVSPGVKLSYRITSIDPAAGTQGATVLVPSSAGAPDNPAGFALYGASVLVFTEKALTRYDFATGAVGAPEIIDPIGTIIAAASPPCASTL